MGSSASTDDSKKSKEDVKKFKIVAIGNSSVGKTCLLYRFCGENFPSISEATIGFHIKIRKVIIENEAIELRFWDTAGDEKYQDAEKMSKLLFRDVDGVLLVYDITDTNSFSKAPKWLEFMRKHSESDIPIVLIGNKADREMKRAITSKMGKELAREMETGKQKIRFFETSASSEEYLRSREAIVNHLALEVKLNYNKYSRDPDDTIQVEKEEDEGKKKRSCC